MKKIIFILLLTCIIYCIKPYVKSQTIEKHYVDVNLDQEFDLNSICVLLQNNVSITNCIYDIDMFLDVNASKVTDNTEIIYEEIINYRYYNIGFVDKSIINEFKRDLTISWNEAKTKEEIIEIIHILECRDDIYCVSPNYLYFFQGTIPNDTYYNSMMGMFNNLNMLNVWDLVTGSRTVKVGIIDTGVSLSEFDLTSNMNNNIHKDFVNPNNPQPLTDTHYHGSIVASILGTDGNNSTSGTGICWNVCLASLKVSNSSTATSSLVRQAINYAEQQGISILNFSAILGSFSLFNTDDYLFTIALNNYSGLFVCAAGNNNLNIDDSHVYPACLSSSYSNVISVSAINSNDQLLYCNNLGSYVNYGINSVSIFTLGDLQYSSLSGVTQIKGTSFATPIVTGAAALLLSLNNSLSPSDLKSILVNNAESFSLYKNENPVSFLYVAKKLDIYSAVMSVVSGLAQNLNNHVIQDTSYNYFHEEAYLSNNDSNYQNNIFFKINVIDSALYLFLVSYASRTSISIYDSNFVKLNIYNSDNIYSFKCYKYLNIGTYYIKMETSSNSVVCPILDILYTTTILLAYDTINYFDSSANNLNVKYQNNNSSDYYDIVFMPIDPLGEELLEIPDSMLEIYADLERTQLLSHTTASINSVTIFLEQSEFYYFDIEINISDLTGYKIIIT